MKWLAAELSADCSLTSDAANKSNTTRAAILIRCECLSYESNVRVQLLLIVLPAIVRQSEGICRRGPCVWYPVGLGLGYIDQAAFYDLITTTIFYDGKFGLE